ncbi:hypothetical protein TNCV_1196791 [Trichonephila clavipes]|uniref:Uncharacterized protein n=1 Tax=Trichonephila clavipes TaxID=2585209 RepID=A0A8X6RZ84_TRICX|nr:hypothetical protein TNCV_1196791 [Trichonephila clavipes]
MSSFLGFCEGDTRNRWRDGQVCPDVDKELWRLGPDGSGRKKKRGPGERRKSREKGQESPGERTDGRRRRDGKERGETERDGKRVGERERVMPALNGKKG